MAEDTPKDPRSLSRDDFEKAVIVRTRADPAFKTQLLAEPKAALKAVYGVDLPPEVELQVLQETPSKFYLVLPVAAREMTDDQLAAVAGGVGLAVHVCKDVTSVRLAESMPSVFPFLEK